MKYKTSFLLGKKTNKEWSGVYGYEPEELDDSFNLGYMYAVVRFATDHEDFALEKFAKIIVETLQQSYYEELKDYRSTLQRLEESCWKMKSKMDLLLSREPEIAESGIDMEMAVVVLKQEYFYAASIGESKVYISRDDSLVEISEGLTDNKNSGFLKSGSLETKEDDKFCISTSKATLDEENLTLALNNLNIELLEQFSKPAGLSIMFIANEGLKWDINPSKEDEETETPDSDLSIEKEGDAQTEETLIISDADKDQITDSDNVPEKANVESKAMGTEVEKEDQVVEPKQEELSEDENAAASADIKEDLSRRRDVYENLKKKSTNIFGDIKGKAVGFISNIRSKSKHEDSDEPQSDTENKVGVAISKGVGVAKGVKSKVENHFRENQTTYVHILRNIRDSIAKLFNRLRNLFEKEVIGKPVDRRFMNKQRIKRNRLLLTIIIVVLGVFIFTQSRNSAINTQRDEAKAEVTKAIADFEAELSSIAVSVKDSQFVDGGNKEELNNQIIKLENSINKQIEELNSMDYLQNPEEYAKKLKDILNQLQDKEDELLLIDSFEEPNVIVDLAADYQSASPTDLEYSEGYLFVSDDARDVIYRIDPISGGAVEEFIDDVKEPQLLVKDAAGDIIVYDHDSDLVLGKFSPREEGNLERLPGLTPPTIGKVDEVAIYQNNNALYELRTLNSYIFKREKIGLDYAGGGNPFKEGASANWKTDPELSNAVDIETPYEVYILSTNLGLRRYLGGGPNTLEFSTFKNLLRTDFNAFQDQQGKPNAIDAVSNYLAVSDSARQRIFLFEIEDTPEKGLKLVHQFKYRGNGDTLSQVNEIQIDVTNQKLYVLDGTKVIKLDFSK